MISVLVTDDHTVLRKGVAALLESEPDMIAVGEAATADQAVIKARALQPDVILLDVVMPRKRGFDALPANDSKEMDFSGKIDSLFLAVLTRRFCADIRYLHDSQLPILHPDRDNASKFFMNSAFSTVSGG